MCKNIAANRIKVPLLVHQDLICHISSTELMRPWFQTFRFSSRQPVMQVPKSYTPLLKRSPWTVVTNLWIISSVDQSLYQKVIQMQQSHQKSCQKLMTSFYPKLLARYFVLPILPMFCEIWELDIWSFADSWRTSALNQLWEMLLISDSWWPLQRMLVLPNRLRNMNADYGTWKASLEL